MSKTKLTGRENLTKYAFCLGPVGPTDKENQVKLYKKYCFRFIPSLKNGKDPDPYQSEKPDLDQKGLDPQHC
jgi:hypothetical protein